MLAKSSQPIPKHIAVIGAGTIGPDIGYYLKSQISPLRLTLVDVAEAALDKATQRIAAYAEKGLKRGKLTAAQARAATQDIVATQDYDALGDADWVIEAATENLALKQTIFSQAEARVSPQALLTSNTSSIPAERIFARLQHPQRATVTHFFAPAFTNPIVEVVDWEHLDSAHLDWLRYLFAATGKVPMVTRDVPCFMLDRIFDNWCNEAGMLLDIATAAQIDSVAQRWVHAGPFFVLNLANGNPIIIETNELQAEAEGDHYKPASIFRSVAQWQTISPGKQSPAPEEVARQIEDRLLGILFSQSLDILDQKIGEAHDLELGSRLAFGFRSGPLEMIQADHGRAQRVLAKLNAERPGMPMPAEDLAAYAADRQFVLCDDVNGVKVITLRRPEALNALHDHSNDEILELLKRYENDDETVGFVITGYGRRAFCSGADLGRFTDLLGDFDGALAYAKSCSRVLLHLDTMRKPVVAAINGMALGGGFELAMRCNALLGVAHTSIQLPEITLGIAPGIGAMAVPFRRWPNAAEVLSDMLFSGRPVDAETARDAGLLQQVVAQESDLLDAAVGMAREMAHPQPSTVDLNQPVSLPAFEPTGKSFNGRALSAEVISLMRNGLAEAAGAPSLSEALEAGYRCFAATACTAAARHGITSFLNSEQPDFEQTG